MSQRLLGAVFIVLLYLSAPTSVKAQSCDSCVAGAVAKASVAINASLTNINTNLTEIGRAVQQLIESNISGHDATAQAIVSTSQIEVNEAHLLEEKVETLKVVQRTQDRFGSLSEDLCYEVELTAGKGVDDSIIQGIVGNQVNEFTSEYLSLYRGTGARSRVLRENIPEDINISDYFGGNTLASPEMIAALPTVTLALTEHESFEAPKEPGILSRTNPREEDYRQKYRSRLFQQQIARNQVMETIVDNSIPSIPIGDWASTKLQQAGYDPDNYVSSGRVTKAGLMKALGSAQFSNEGASEIAGLTGDELNRKLIQMIGHQNYLMAEQWKEANQTKLNLSLQLSHEIEKHYNPKLKNAILSTPR